MTISVGQDPHELDPDGLDPDDGAEAGGHAGTTPSWLDHLTDDDAEPEDATSLAQWEGDAGTLNPAQRKTLVVLLKHRFITDAKQPTEWRVLIESESLIRSRLNDLFLDLHLDRVRGVAFKRQAVSEAGERFPTLLHDTAWGREETILMIFLRTRFRSERTNGPDDVIVDRDELLERVAQFRPSHATDVAGDTRKTDNAIEMLKRTGILFKTSDEHRLMVSPVIEVLLPVEKLQQLLAWFLTHNDPDEPVESTAEADSFDLATDTDDLADDDTDDVEADR
jgi:uncharacterized protein DUF4194